MKKRESHIFEKAKDGFYVEPSWCSARLFEVETFKGVVYDPACGWGTITTAARAAGYQVRGSDTINRRRHGLKAQFFKTNFLTLPRVGRTNMRFSVVTNPPFDHVQEFCEHALALGAVKVAAIMLVRRLNAAHWLRDLPLQTVYLLSPRPSMPPGSWIAEGNKPGGGTQDFAWVVLRPGFKGAPALQWLHRDFVSSTRGHVEMTGQHTCRSGRSLKPNRNAKTLPPPSSSKPISKSIFPRS